MAKNQVFSSLAGISVTPTDPSAITSGIACRFGAAVGVALNDEESDGTAVVDFTPKVWDLSVKGENDGGNNAVVAGDSLYYTDADAFLSGKDSGFFAGIAMEGVDSGATTTIRVMINPSVGPGEAQVIPDSIGGVELKTGWLNVSSLAGGSAGSHTVTGMVAGDEIVYVGHISTAAAIATWADITGEFTAEAGGMENGGGTDTANDQLFVIWIDKSV